MREQQLLALLLDDGHCGCDHQHTTRLELRSV
jgi:hypothetical protein